MTKSLLSTWDVKDGAHTHTASLNAEKSNDMRNEKRNVTVGYTSGEETLKQRVYTLFQQNQSLTAKKACSILHLSIRDKGQTIRNYLSEFRCNPHFGRVPSTAHNLPHSRKWLGSKVVFSVRAEKKALSCGWRVSKNRNRMLVYRHGLGSVEWFRNGTVLVHVRGSSNVGVAKTLFCRAFSWLDDAELLRLCEGPFREFKRQWVIEQGKAFPRFEIKQFEKSHGLRIFSDGSHPTAVEVEETVPLYMQPMIEQQNRLAENLEILSRESKIHLEMIEIWKREAAERAAAYSGCVGSGSPGLAEGFWVRMREVWRLLVTPL